MANIPTPRSFNAILGDMVDAFISRFGLKGLRKGSPVLSILEAAAQSDLRSTQDVFDLLNATSLDRATGISLDRIAADEDLIRITESPASGTVTVSDSSFTKQSTRIYQGSAAPIIGSGTINVVDATNFPATGSIYLGRGSTNYEGPLAYSAKTNNGTFWTLTLTDKTKKFHNLGESVILAQGGNRTISSGTIVQTPQGNIADAIQFSVLYSATILDGETSVSNVMVVAQRPGVIGNVSVGSINSFVTPPFTGATVTNPLPFTNGEATEDDSTFRERIRNVRQSRSLGTPLAIKTSITGVTSSDENKRITSASVVIRQGEPTTVYIDDGTGYEERSTGIAVESLIDRANGGEQYFQVISRPIAKAFVRSLASAPFNLKASSQLSVAVGGVISTHTFDESEFRAIGNASAYEVAASINANPNLKWLARTFNSGAQVEILAKGDVNEDVQISGVNGTNANEVLLFPTSKVESLRLYKNDKLLSKDGQIASILSNPYANWGVLSGNQTLEVDVDGTGSVTYTFSNDDFVNAKTGFVTLGKNTVEAWVAVFNKRIPGITASAASGLISFTSNAGTTSRASVEILGGSLVSAEMFEVVKSVGKDRDYTLDRNLGQIRLETPLSEGDRLTAGTLYTRAFLGSSSITATSVTDGKLWFIVDGSAEVRPTSINSATSFSFTNQSSHSWGNRVRLTSNPSSFSNVQVGDWAIMWDSAIPSNGAGTYRISDVDSSGAWVEFDRKCMSAARSLHTATSLSNGRILVTGGVGGDGTSPLSHVEMYQNGIWTARASMSVPRYGHSAVAISATKVMVMGGYSVGGEPTNTCEIYDVNANTWTSAAVMPDSKVRGVAGYLSSPNKVVFAGGRGGLGAPEQTAFVYNVATNAWTSTNMSVPRVRATGTVISSTKFLVAGGDDDLVVHNNGDVYTEGTGWAVTSALSNMASGRTGHAASVMSSGNVLISGGSASTDLSSPLNTVSIFNPSTNGFTAGTAMGTGRVLHYQATLSSGQILVTQGVGVATSEISNLANSSWTAVSDSVPLSTDGSRFGATLAVNSGGAVLSGGSFASSGAFPLANSASYSSAATPTWQSDNRLSTDSFSLSTNGIVFAKSLQQVQQVNLPSATYLASTLSSSIASQLVGASPSVYRTNTLRVSTNTFADGGDVALVAADSEGLKSGLTTGNSVENTGSHLASVESGNSDLGTPSFQVHEALAQESGSLHLSGNVGSSAHVFGSLESWDDSSERFGNHYSFKSFTSGSTARGGSTLVNLRNTLSELTPKSLMWSASTYSFGPEESLVVVADGDTTTKRFVVPMWRKLKPVGSYGSTITLKDADNSNKTLAEAFGLNFNFNDFALHQSARTITHSSDSSKSILWRYYRKGPEGNLASLRYVYPQSANSPVSVTTDAKTSVGTRIHISLPSGAAKTGYTIRPSTKVGVNAQLDGSMHKLTYILGYPIASATRSSKLNYSNEQNSGFTAGNAITGATSGATATVSAVTDNGSTGVLTLTNVNGVFTSGENLTVGGQVRGAASGTSYQLVDLTLTAPASSGVTNSGFSAGQYIYVNGAGNFQSGLKTVTSASGMTVSYIEVGTDGTATNVGTVSYDVGPVSLSGPAPALAVGDIFTLGAASGVNSEWEQTIRITALGPQFIQGMAIATTGRPTSATPSWEDLNDVSSFSVYPLSGNTATAIASAVNNLTGSSVNATLLGSGSGTITQSTNDESGGSTWYDLVDGVNYIKATASPALLTGDYQFELKNPISSTLSSVTNDWANEDVRLVPVSTETVTRWLNSPAVTGLSSVCEVKASSAAQKVQISSLTAGSGGSVQVQGGLANEAAATVIGSATLVSSTYPLVTVAQSDASGLAGGSWVALDNSVSMPKSVFEDDTVLESIATDGTFVISGTPVYTQVGDTLNNTKWIVARQGRFTCFAHKIQSTITAPIISANEGDWVRISAPTSPTSPTMNILNLGIFRVVRTQKTGSVRAFWVENANSVEGFFEGDVRFFSFDSLMPGDTISISTDAWGSDNKGQWVVSDAGNGFTNPNTFKVVGSPKAISGNSTALGSDNAKLIRVLEAKPSRLIKKISAISPNGTEFADIKFTTPEGYALISEAAGTIITALDKLGFDSDTVVGIDGYAYSTGLIGEANRILYGDLRDSASYPGVIAAGAKVNISGPVVRRIQVGLSLRIRSGISSTDIASRVRSVVAAAINSSQVGESIAISDIVAEASRVNGVLAVSVTSPSYTSSNDLIPVQPQEKALVLSLEQDVTISFTGE